MMNELQRTQLGLLERFVEICERLGLRYFLVCGSALGAVKYGGFIPWDDDIDVALFREDYEVFLEKAPEMLPEGLFLQNYRSEPAFPAIYSKLRHSGTAFVERSASGLPINHGIFIDIFPLDGYPAKKWEQRRLELEKAVYRRLLSTAFRPNRTWKWILTGPFRLLGVHRHTASIARRYDALVSQYPVSGSARIANHGNWQGKQEYAPAEQYGRGTWGCFEGLTVRLPEQTDAYLRQKYGDYTRDPPEGKRKGHHDCILWDSERSYKEIKL